MGIKDKITGASAATVAKSGGVAVAVGTLASVAGPGTAALAAVTVGAIAAITPSKDGDSKDGDSKKGK